MRNVLLGSISGLAVVVGIAGNAAAATWYDYTVKFVCGTSEDGYAGYEEYVPVYPGTYYTAINIHDPNYNYKAEEGINKPEVYATAYVLFPYNVNLEYDEGDDDYGDEYKPSVDGYRIWEYNEFFRGFELDCGHIYGQDFGKYQSDYYDYGQQDVPGLIKGVVSIYSKYRLDISAVYTASVGEDGGQVSIDVEQYSGRKYSTTSGRSLELEE